MNVQEAAKRLGKGESTIRRWIRDGKIEASMINGTYDIPESAINEQLISSQTAEDGRSQITAMRVRLESIERENDRFIEQLKEKDKQISELHQLLMASETRSRQLIEYQQVPFWRRWFGRKEKTIGSEL